MTDPDQASQPRAGDTAGTKSAKHRLQASREALMHQLVPSSRPRASTGAAMHSARNAPADTPVRKPDAASSVLPASQDRGSVRKRASGTWSLAKHSLNAWWQFHPARAVAAIAQPVVAEYAERKPWKLLGIAAGVGAAVVVTKPWRLISAGGLAVAALKSSHVSNAALSLLSARKARSGAALRDPA